MMNGVSRAFARSGRIAANGRAKRSRQHPTPDRSATTTPSWVTTRPISISAASTASTATALRYRALSRSRKTGTRTPRTPRSDLDFGIDIDTWALGAGYRYPLRTTSISTGGCCTSTAKWTVPGRSMPMTTASGLQARHPHARQRRVRGRGRHSAPRRRRQRHVAAGQRSLPLQRGISRPASA